MSEKTRGLAGEPGVQNATGESRAFRYYEFCVVAMVTVLLCANLIGPAKVCALNLPLLGLVSFGAGNLFFPVSYLFDDVLTEVYGYARARRAIWAGFGAMAFATFMSYTIIHMPADPAEPWNSRLQPALETVFGNTWRIAAASMLGYWVGDFANSYVMAKMKLATQGRWLWTRTIGSTIVGEGLDSMVFYPLAFYGIWTHEALIKVMLFNFSLKVLVEVVFTPLTYAVVGWLKRAEGVEIYDQRTDFSPFTLRE